jgi:hypothetical protein
MQGRQQIGVPGSNWNTVYQGVLRVVLSRFAGASATSGSLFRRC